MKRVFTDDELRYIRQNICADCSADDIRLFVDQCQRTGLDPFSKQIIPVVRYDKKKAKNVMSIQISLDGLRLVAEGTGKYAGQEGPFWCGPDGVWKDVWLEDSPPAAAKVGVIRKGWPKPINAVVLWRDFAQYDGNGNLTSFWDRMGAHMLAKVAETHALRRAGLHVNVGESESDAEIEVEAGDTEKLSPPSVPVPPPSAPVVQPVKFGPDIVTPALPVTTSPVAPQKPVNKGNSIAYINLINQLSGARTIEELTTIGKDVKTANNQKLVSPSEFESLVLTGKARRKAIEQSIEDERDDDIEREAIQNEGKSDQKAAFDQLSQEHQVQWNMITTKLRLPSWTTPNDLTPAEWESAIKYIETLPKINKP